MNLIDKKFILDNNEEYLIIETVEYNNKNYVYMVNKTNGIDSMYAEVVYDGQLKVEAIEPKLFSEKILPLFMEKFKNY